MHVTEFMTLLSLKLREHPAVDEVTVEDDGTISVLVSTWFMDHADNFQIIVNKLDNDIPEKLSGYDWDAAFEYANPSRVIGDTEVSAERFYREDVEYVYGAREGENDGDEWLVYGKLRDGRYFYLSAWCDYTGWGCQEGGESFVSSDYHMLIRFGMPKGARSIFNIKGID